MNLIHGFVISRKEEVDFTLRLDIFDAVNDQTDSKQT